MTDTAPLAQFAADDDAQASAGAPLFIDDKELRRRINPRIGMDRFKAALLAAERDPSFPRVKALWGGRYWPAVKAWFDNDNGVNGNEVTSTADDTGETYATPRRKARLQARPAPAPVLDRQTGGARPHGLPRLVHRSAGGAD